MESHVESGARVASRTKLVAVAFALLLIHNLDEAFWHREEANGRLDLLLVFAVSVVTLFAYPRLGRWVRSIWVGLLGALAAVAAGGGHIAHFFTGNVQPIDYSGFTFFAGGLLLLWVAVKDATNS